MGSTCGWLPDPRCGALPKPRADTSRAEGRGRSLPTGTERQRGAIPQRLLPRPQTPHADSHAAGTQKLTPGSGRGREEKDARGTRRKTQESTWGQAGGDQAQPHRHRDRRAARTTRKPAVQATPHARARHLPQPHPWDPTPHWLLPECRLSPLSGKFRRHSRGPLSCPSSEWPP